ncbi:24746_t:CDS:2 [Gigaspora margarita]|uniref:24746_t:CDS:1 n=1 Tax=Gigaspora margarita TaxID=4874 RepID=A0ABN7V0D1_GIGMA|nr:24746_t:CDS:2 [Gigaspora margarita]
MAEDFIKKNIPKGQLYINAILKHIDSFLQQYDKNINDYDLPKTTNIINKNLPKIILEELSIPVLFDNIEKIKSLNETQKKVFDFIIQKIDKNKFDIEIAMGEYSGKRIFFHRILLISTQDVKLPFTLKRKQFPIKLAFALMVNKSQAFSRVKSSNNLKILIKNGKILGKEGTYTRNVVYKEALDY